jgi:hypothetical protein
MSCIVSLGQDGYWMVSNAIYRAFVSLVLQRPLSPAAAEALQMSEYVNGLDLVGLRDEDDRAAMELSNLMVEVAAAIAAGNHVLENHVTQEVIREKFAQLVQSRSFRLIAGTQRGAPTRRTTRVLADPIGQQRECREPR